MSADRKNATPTEEQIRVRAYEIYAGRGYQDDNEQGDWLQAEQELTEELRKGETMVLGEPELQPVATQAGRRPDRQARTRESLSRN